MNIDQRIQQELQEQAREIDAFLASEDGFIGSQKNILKGGMRRWAMLMLGIGIINGIAFIWAAVRFFKAETDTALIFWGVLLLFFTLFSLGIKLWGWIEASRISVMREIKRVEIAVAGAAPNQAAKDPN